ncbi:hypothetical protein JW756_02315 [Candidatus Woesearchaeota archaeon]|nr:hypothetical protein [Candidatus Woesearchaeota archaeon]
MKKELQKKLHLKGWSKQEIAHARKIMSQAERKKHPDVRKLEQSMYWFTLIIGVLGTILLSLVLMPILIINNNHWSYILTGVFGFILGSIIVIIIKDLHWLESHHHLSLSLAVPIVALFNFFIVVNRINLLNYSLGLARYHNPVLLGIDYFVCFLVPYIIFLALKRGK